MSELPAEVELPLRASLLGLGCRDAAAPAREALARLPRPAPADLERLAAVLEDALRLALVTPAAADRVHAAVGDYLAAHPVCRPVPPLRCVVANGVRVPGPGEILPPAPDDEALASEGQ